MFSTHHILYDLVFAIVLLDLQEVVAEIQDIKATLLSQKHDDHTASPVQAVSKALPETGNTLHKARFTYTFRNISTINAHESAIILNYAYSTLAYVRH